VKQNWNYQRTVEFKQEISVSVSTPSGVPILRIASQLVGIFRSQLESSFKYFYNVVEPGYYICWSPTVHENMAVLMGES